MKAGLLWYDDDPERDLLEKVHRAVNRYEDKFGTTADVCYVHPSALNGNGSRAPAGKVRIEPLSTVLVNHLWVGRDEKSAC